MKSSFRSGEIDVKDQIELLVCLQRLDSEIILLQSQLEQQPEEEQLANEALKSEQTHLDEQEGAFKSVQLKQKEQEVSLQSLEDTIKKYQVQLLQVKTNKEYSALQNEINGLRADCSVLEEDLLRTLDEVERLKAALDESRAAYQKKEQEVRAELQDMRSSNAEAIARLEQLKQQRKSSKESIEPKVLAKYERIHRSRPGLAVVPVINESCSGCHMGLPPQAINEIQIADDIVVCETCARILYIPPESAAA